MLNPAYGGSELPQSRLQLLEAFIIQSLLRWLLYSRAIDSVRYKNTVHGYRFRIEANTQSALGVEMILYIVFFMQIAKTVLMHNLADRFADTSLASSQLTRMRMESNYLK